MCSEYSTSIGDIAHILSSAVLASTIECQQAIANTVPNTEIRSEITAQRWTGCSVPKQHSIWLEFADDSYFKNIVNVPYFMWYLILWIFTNRTNLRKEIPLENG